MKQIVYFLAAAMLLAPGTMCAEATEFITSGRVAEEPFCLEMAESRISVYSSDVIAMGQCGVSPSSVKWTLYKNGSLLITGSGRMLDYEVGAYSTDDSSPRQAPWKSLNAVTPIKSVIIDSDVKSIGANAFSECAMLQSIMFTGSSIESIGNRAFWGCNSIKEIEIPGRIQHIGTNAFGKCQSLADIYYEGYGYTWFKAIEADSVPDTVVVHFKDNIFNSGYASQNGYDVTWSLTVDGALTIMGNGEIPNYIDKAPWCGIAQVPIKTVSISDDISYIGRNAFSNCSELSEIKIPCEATTIAPYAFRGCSALKSVKIPKSITFIGGAAFDSCESLSDVYYGGEQTDWDVLDIGLENECLTEANVHYNSYPAYGHGACGDDVTWLLDSNGVLTISGTGAMSDYSPKLEPGSPVAPWRGSLQKRIQRVIIEEGVTSIGSYAFYYCPLISVNIPYSASTIGKGAFACCSNLSEVFYGGTKANWDLVKIAAGNNGLYNISLHCARADLQGRIRVVGAIVSAISLGETDEHCFPAKVDGRTYTIPNLPVGSYAIRVEKNGYIPYETMVKLFCDTLLPDADLVLAGDINASGKVEITDMACLYTYLSTNEYNGAIQDELYWRKVSDVNGDGIINILDYQYLYCTVTAATGLPQHPYDNS